MSAPNPDPSDPARVTVFVRPRSPIEGANIAELSALPASERHYPSRAEFAASHGADPADLAAVEAFARARGLRVESSSVPLRSVVVSGSASAITSAFGASIRRVPGDPASPRSTPESADLPPEIAPIVESVLGLDDRPYARPHGPEGA